MPNAWHCDLGASLPWPVQTLPERAQLLLLILLLPLSVADAWCRVVTRGLGYRSLRRAQRERPHRGGGGAHCIVWRVRSSAAEIAQTSVSRSTRRARCAELLQSRL